MTSASVGTKGVSKLVPRHEDEFNKYLSRVGYASKDRWTWLLRLVNRYRTDHAESWLYGEWDIVCGELAAFTLGETSAPGYGVIAQMGGVFTEKPKHEEAKAMLDLCLRMIEDAADHKPIVLAAVRVEVSLRWDDKVSDYKRSEVYDDRTTWLDRVSYPLSRMIDEDGRRLRRCPSKQPHGRKPCANLFIKNKRGLYCSPACTSREMSRARRIRDEESNRARDMKVRKKK